MTFFVKFTAVARQADGAVPLPGPSQVGGRIDVSHFSNLAFKLHPFPGTTARRPVNTVQGGR